MHVMETMLDAVVVGGGIAGSALATVLARAGHEVLVLEREARYRDKVRGEVLLCWGVAELQRLGLEQVLLDAGGHYATRSVAYDEVTDPAQAEANAAPLDAFLPGVPGLLDVGHPEACAALADAAAAAGATVLHGVGAVEVTPGDPPLVRYCSPHPGRHRRSGRRSCRPRRSHRGTWSGSSRYGERRPHGYRNTSYCTRFGNTGYGMSEQIAVLRREGRHAAGPGRVRGVRSTADR